MNKMLSRQFARAKDEGRICSRCGYMITVKAWDKGYRQCPSCFDALKGVNVNIGHWPKRDEPSDKTGEML